MFAEALCRKAKLLIGFRKCRFILFGKQRFFDCIDFFKDCVGFFRISPAVQLISCDQQRIIILICLDVFVDVWRKQFFRFCEFSFRHIDTGTVDRLCLGIIQDLIIFIQQFMGLIKTLQTAQAAKNNTVSIQFCLLILRKKELQLFHIHQAVFEFSLRHKHIRHILINTGKIFRSVFKILQLFETLRQHAMT